jgi:hypothetical protein
MKRVHFIVTMDCQENIPDRVVEWMAVNLAEYVSHEFGDDYDAESVKPAYDGPPLLDDGNVTVQVMGNERPHRDTSDTQTSAGL